MKFKPGDIVKVCACGRPECDAFKVNWPAVRTFRSLMYRHWLASDCPKRASYEIVNRYLRMVADRYHMAFSDFNDHLFIGDNYQRAMHQQAHMHIFEIPDEVIDELFRQGMMQMSGETSNPTFH